MSALRRRGADAPTLRAKPLRARNASDAAMVIQGIRRSLYGSDTWALFTEVRNTPGVAEVIRYADAIAVQVVDRGKRFRIHGFEVKTSFRDLARELEHPEKARPIQMYCDAWWLVVPAPRRNVVPSTLVLPDRWGLLEIGTGDPLIVVPAEEREAEPVPVDLIRSLLRKRARADLLPDGPVAPLVPINRPLLSRRHVGLVCGHATATLAKMVPDALPCLACLEGRPADVEVVEAMIEDAPLEDVQRFAALIDRRLGRRGVA